VPTVEVQSWKQIVRDATGKAIAVREVPFPQSTSSIRQAVDNFAQYVLQNKGDLKASIEAELQDARRTLSDLLTRLNSSRDTNEVTHLRGPVSAMVALVPYLEDTLERAEIITVGEFTARALEKEASQMPASMKDQADSLRRAAQIEREFGSNKMIRVWELPPDKSQESLT
jgi:hypothetical protein